MQLRDHIFLKLVHQMQLTIVQMGECFKILNHLHINLFWQKLSLLIFFLPRQYISSFTCTNTKYSARFHRSTLGSFPSAHSAYSLYVGLFMIWYLQCRTRVLKVKYLVSSIQFVILLWPVFCSISRITDNRHHWWDVLCGLVIGTVMTCFVVRLLFYLLLRLTNFQDNLIFAL